MLYGIIFIANIQPEDGDYFSHIDLNNTYYVRNCPNAMQLRQRIHFQWKDAVQDGENIVYLLLFYK